LKKIATQAAATPAPAITSCMTSWTGKPTQAPFELARQICEELLGIVGETGEAGAAT